MGRQGELPKRCLTGADCGRRSARQALFCLRSQCRCVLPDPPAAADSCPAPAGQSHQRMGFPDFLGKTSRAAKVKSKTPFQRSGARDLPSGGRADEHKQAGFTSGVKRSRRRTSPTVCTVCLAQTGQGKRRSARDAGRPGIPLAQNSPLFQGGVALLFQTFPPLAQNAPVPAAPLPQPECTARRRRNFSRRVFPACSAIPKGALFASNTAPVLPKMSPRTAIFVDKREKF